jgi:hypothetical protein
MGTARISPESEIGSQMIAAVATVLAVGMASSAFRAALLSGMVPGITAIMVPGHLPRTRAALNPLFREPILGPKFSR